MSGPANEELSSLGQGVIRIVEYRRQRIMEAGCGLRERDVMGHLVEAGFPRVPREVWHDRRRLGVTGVGSGPWRSLGPKKGASLTEATFDLFRG